MCVETVRNDRDERAVRPAGSASGIPRWSDRALKPVYLLLPFPNQVIALDIVSCRADSRRVNRGSQ